MNSFAPIDPALIDYFPTEHDGYPDALAAEDTFDNLWDACGSASRTFPQALWIEAKDREEKARENDKNHTWGINYVDRFTNQSPTHECTCHGLRTGAEGCRNRQRGIIFPDGPKKDFRYEESSKGSVWLSPMSVYARANPGQWGGANCLQVLNLAIKYGFLPEKIQPREYGFKHTLQGTAGKGGKNQSSGPWTRPENFPEGCQATADWFKVQEVIIVNDWEQALCLLLHGYVINYGRNGHAVPPCIVNFAQNAVGYVDSYDIVRWDSFSTFKSAVRSSAYAIASMTTPDDWLKPAG